MLICQKYIVKIKFLLISQMQPVCLIYPLQKDFHQELRETHVPNIYIIDFLNVCLMDLHISFCRTIFTKTERHTYVDPDYAYDEGELSDVMSHKNKYNDYLKECRDKRVSKIKAKWVQVTWDVSLYSFILVAGALQRWPWSALEPMYSFGK